MTTISLTISTAGLDEAVKALDPKQVYVILNQWYDRGSSIMATELRSRARASLRGGVYIRMDKVRPPRWARIGVRGRLRGRLAHLIEGGTGSQGDPAFNHVDRHWPSTEGIMRETGLPRSRAFLIARAIGRRGGNPARPFIRPTWAAKRAEVEGLMERIAGEVLAGGGA